MPLSTQNKTKSRLPRVPFEQIKKSVLKESYELSLVFVGHAASKRLNSSLRGKNSPTNILSFPLSSSSGEIFIDLAQVKKEYKKFEMNFDKFVGFLFIHGLLHLKGMEHGVRMEQAEKKFLKKFFPSAKNGSTNNPRN